MIRKEKGLTLVELIISMMLFSFLIVVVVSFAVALSGPLADKNTEIDSLMEANRVLTMIKNDFLSNEAFGVNNDILNIGTITYVSENGVLKRNNVTVSYLNNVHWDNTKITIYYPSGKLYWNWGN